MDASAFEPRPSILLVLTEFPPRIGGMQVHAIELANFLAARGFRIRVVTYRPTPGFEDAERAFDAALAYEVERLLSRVAHFDNLDLLERAASRFGPDLIYCSTVFYGALADRCGVPVVCRSAGNDVLRPWIGYPFRRFSRLVGTPWFEHRLYRFFRRLEYPDWLHMIFRRRRCALMADAARRYRTIFANSHYTAERLGHVGVDADRVHVLPGGVDVESFATKRRPAADLRRTHGIPPDRFVLLTACRLERRKGVDFLIRSMDALVERIPNAHLLIVGDGRARASLETLAREPKAHMRITFAGSVAHERMPALYTASDVFVLASRLQVDSISGAIDAETMGRVLCEANAASIPAVAARSGGIPSIIEHGVNGLLFAPDDADDFIDCIATLYESAGLRDSLVRRGRDRAAAEFDWSVIFRAHEEAFERIGRSTTLAPT